MRDIRSRLEDILEAITQIQLESAKGKEAFEATPLVQVWMVHHLLIIGEAVRAIDRAFRQKHAAVPWRQIAGMRNILVHDYFRINQRIVWETVEKDVPFLKTQIVALLSALPNDSHM
jgi:uncharacterized protein with HEPN domain